MVVDLKLMNEVEQRTVADFETAQAWLERRNFDPDAWLAFCDKHVRASASENAGLLTIFGVGLQLGYEIRRAQQEPFDG